MHDSIDVPVATAAFVAVLVGVAAAFFLPGDKENVCPKPQAGSQWPWEICSEDGGGSTKMSTSPPATAPFYGTYKSP